MMELLSGRYWATDTQMFSPSKSNRSGVVHVALPQDDVLLQLPGFVHHEQVADAFPGGPVVPVLRGRVLDGAFDDFHGRRKMWSSV